MLVHRVCLERQQVGARCTVGPAKAIAESAVCIDVVLDTPEAAADTAIQEAVEVTALVPLQQGVRCARCAACHNHCSSRIQHCLVQPVQLVDGRQNLQISTCNQDKS